MMRALRRLLAPDLHWSSALRIDQAAVHRSALITHEGEQARLVLDGRNVGNEGHWSLTVRAPAARVEVRLTDMRVDDEAPDSAPGPVVSNDVGASTVEAITRQLSLALFMDAALDLKGARPQQRRRGA